MMTIREYKQAESLEEAWQLNQKKANRVLGGMIWLKICLLYTSYYAQAGEELFGIARRFHVSPAQILTANGLEAGTPVSYTHLRQS